MLFLIVIYNKNNNIGMLTRVLMINIMFMIDLKAVINCNK